MYCMYGSVPVSKWRGSWTIQPAADLTQPAACRLPLGFKLIATNCHPAESK